MKKLKLDKQKIFTGSITVILLVFFIGGFSFGLSKVRSMEGTFPPNILVEGKSKAPGNIGEAVELLEKTINIAKNGKPSVRFDDYFNISSDSVTTDGSQQLLSTILLAVDNFEDHISVVEDDLSHPDYNKDSNAIVKNFGENVSEILNIPEIQEKEVESFSCSYTYYSCPSCGESSDNADDKCEECGSNRPYELRYRDEYSLSLVFDISENQIFDKFFPPRTDKDIRNLVEEKIKDTATINKINVSYNGLRLNYNVRRLTDEITSVSITKDMNVSAEVTFIGRYEDLGSCTVSFDISETDRYRFTWPGISLSASDMVIEPKGKNNLLATLTCEDPVAYADSVIWTSSDENIAVVDEEGYIKASANEGEVVIAASYEYLGETYVSECLVHIRVPVESMRMLDKAVKLSVGETATLKAKVSPSDATVKDVEWYSENNEIASVDLNGVVTAHKEGSVIVYALSKDGYYKSTCEVTVR